MIIPGHEEIWGLGNMDGTSRMSMLHTATLQLEVVMQCEDHAYGLLTL